MSVKYYNMEGREITQAEAIPMFGDPEKVGVNFTRLPGGVEVSTVLLVIDHSHGYGAPIIFESMVFNADFEDMRRYSTIEAARIGHDELVTKWTGWSKGDDMPDDAPDPFSVRDRIDDYRAKTTPGSSYALADDVPWTAFVDDRDLGQGYGAKEDV